MTSIKFCGFQWSGHLNSALFQANVMIHSANLSGVKVQFTWCVNRYSVDINGKYKYGLTANNSTWIKKKECVKCQGITITSCFWQISKKHSMFIIPYYLLNFDQTDGRTPGPRHGSAEPPVTDVPACMLMDTGNIWESQTEMGTCECDPAPCPLSS